MPGSLGNLYTLVAGTDFATGRATTTGGAADELGIAGKDESDAPLGNKSSTVRRG